MASLLRRCHHEPVRPSPLAAAVAAAAQDAQRAALMDAYIDGPSDGIELVLDQLDPASRARSLAPEGRYDGPVPDELRDWMAWARANIDRERAERKGAPAAGSDHG
jgi:hypothetical protein